MAIDTFTGGATSANDWATLGNWSANALPGSTDTADMTNPSGSSTSLGEIFSGNYTIGDLQLQSGFSLSIQGSLTVQNADTVTSTGSVVVSSTGSLTDNNAGNTDLVYVQGGTFTDTNANSADTVNMSDGGTFVFSTNVGSFGNATFGGGVQTMLPGATVDVINSSGASTSGFSIAGNQLQLDFGGGLESINLNFASTNMTDLSVTTSPTNPSEFVITVCFTSGTRISTTRGGVAVEDLAVGDLAVTASGEARPICWIGRKRVERPRRDGWPVRVMAGAFGENRPARDLFLSSGHAVCVDVLGEVFVPIEQLINGATIARVEVPEVTYWHVELESHDVLLAENLPAESYLEMDNRRFFTESGVVDLVATPDAAGRSHADFCRPFHCDDEVVEGVREQLFERARSLGWTLRHDPLADLHLLADGIRIDPTAPDGCAHFHVPAGAQEVWLASDAARPIDVGRGADRRRLGVCVFKMSIQDGVSPAREISLEDDALDEGFHPLEQNGDVRWRWTKGSARLPAAVTAAAHPDGFVLRLDHYGDPMPQWLAPQGEAVASAHAAERRRTRRRANLAS